MEEDQGEKKKDIEWCRYDHGTLPNTILVTDEIKEESSVSTHGISKASSFKVNIKHIFLAYDTLCPFLLSVTELH